MKLVLKTKDDAAIAARDMEPGQIGVITEWSSQKYVGHVVVMTTDRDLITLTKGDGDKWGDTEHLGGACRVRLLQPGETLTVE